MKYNRVEIMSKMHRLINANGMSKSEALRKSWSIAKEIVNLEKELDNLNMYSPTGGATNAFAQMEIRNHRNAIAAVEAKIAALKNEIRPAVISENKTNADTFKINKLTSQMNFYRDTYGENSVVYLKSKKELDELLSKVA